MLNFLAPQGKTYFFYMTSGAVIKVDNVTELTTKYNTETGLFTSYQIKWAEGKKPTFFSLVVPHITAIVAA